MGIKRDVEAMLGQVKEKGWNSMTAEEKKGLLEALIELLMQHGILQKNSERIAEMLKQSLDDAAAGREADVLAKFAKDIRKEPRFTKNACGILQNEIMQMKEDMEDCFWLTAMNTEQMAMLSKKIADGNANAEVMMKNDRIMEAALIKYIDQLAGIHEEIQKCNKETEKKINEIKDMIKGNDWELVELCDGTQAILNRAVDDLDNDGVAAFRIDPETGNLIKYKAEEIMEDSRFAAKEDGFPKTIRKIEENTPIQQMGDAFAEMYNGSTEYLRQLEKAEMLQQRTIDELKTVKETNRKKLSYTNAENHAEQLMLAMAQTKLIQGKTMFYNGYDFSDGIYVEIPKSNLHSASQGGLLYTVSEENGQIDSIQYVTDKKNPVESAKIPIYTHNKNDIALQIPVEYADDINMMLNALPKDEKDLLTHNVELGKHVKRGMESENKVVTDAERAALSVVAKQFTASGYSTSIFGDRVYVENRTSSEPALVLAMNEEGRMYAYIEESDPKTLLSMENRMGETYKENLNDIMIFENGAPADNSLNPFELDILNTFNVPWLTETAMIAEQEFAQEKEKEQISPEQTGPEQTDQEDIDQDNR